MIKLYTDEQILDEAFRKKVIEYINSPGNIERRNAKKKQYDIYKDNTGKWVVDALTKELSPQSVQMMQNRVSNISICRKVINKLARAYSQGVDRTCEDETSTAATQGLAKLTDFDHRMKKVDRYERLFKNAMIHVVPELDSRASDTAGRPLYNIRVNVLAPFMYDVLCDGHSPTQARCVVLSEFKDKAQSPNHQTGNSIQGIKVEGSYGIDTDMEYIWWTAKYHFTTDGKGAVIQAQSPEGLVNIAGVLPDVNFSGDQDGHFWSEGGEDLTDGAVLANVMITDKHCIASQQGWGTAFVTGRGLPDKLELSPHRALIVPYEKDDPEPKFQYVSSNPPLADWRADVEQYIAMLLSTNNLSTKSVSGSLNATDVASGIAKMIDESESSEDINDSQNHFKIKEPEIWAIIKKWYDIYFDANALTEELMEVGKWEDTEVMLKFNQSKPVVTDAERLANLKLKLEMGLISKLEAIKQENPGMDDEQAKEKQAEIEGNKLAMVDDAVAKATGGDDGETADRTSDEV